MQVKRVLSAVRRPALMMCLFALCAVAVMMIGFSLKTGAATGDVAINETNFPDQKFRTHVAAFDENDDGVFSTAEIETVTLIDVHGLGISDLTGIEHFTWLRFLDCSDNILTSLDLRENPNLEEIQCQYNKLTSLNVMKILELKLLRCQNNLLTSLDVRTNPKLELLNCHENQLTALDLSSNTELTTLYCYWNRLYDLDLSANTKLGLFEGWQEIEVAIDQKTMSFTLPDTVDSAKISGLTNATLDERTLLVASNATLVSYLYDVYPGSYQMKVELLVRNDHSHHANYLTGFCNCGYAQPPELVGGVYQIANEGNLVGFAELVNGGQKTANAVLTADIDMKNVTGWVPIGNITNFNHSTSTLPETGYGGVFDGQGHTIKNLTLKGDVTYVTSGIFGTVSGTVKNLGVDNYQYVKTNASLDGRFGAIAGLVAPGGLIENCYVTNSTVDADVKVGGVIAGANYGGIVQYCFTASCEVGGKENASEGMYRYGWIVGDNHNDGEGDNLLIGQVIKCVTDGIRICGTQRGTLDTCWANVSAGRFSSGEMAYFLIDGRPDSIWGQNLGTDARPGFGGQRVVCVTVNRCDGTFARYEYGNGTEDYTKVLDHTFSAVDGICTLCSYACTHTTHTDAGVCADCRKQRGLSVSVGDAVSYFDDMIQAFTAAKTGTEQNPAIIKLLTDVTHATYYKGVVENGAYVALDLNGNTLTFTHKDGSIQVLSGSHFTLMDSSEDGSGIFSGSYSEYASGSYLISVSEQSTMFLQSGRLEPDISADEAILVREESTLIQNGGTIVGTRVAGVGVQYDGTFIQNGGTVISNYYAVLLQRNGHYVLEGGTLILNGEMATGGGGYFDIYLGGTVTIHDGILDVIAESGVSDPTSYQIVNMNGDGEITMNGGTFKKTENTVLYVTGHNFTGTTTIQLKNAIFENGLALQFPETETLGEYLAPGYAYYDENGDIVILTDGLTALTGKVTVGVCTHIDSRTDHICDVCSTVLGECTGGEATCVDRAVCTICAQPYGDLNPENHSGTNNKTVSDHSGKHNIVWSCCDAVVNENLVCIPDNPDNDCTTPDACVCGYVFPTNANHTLQIKSDKDDISHILECTVEGCDHEEDVSHMYNQLIDDRYLASDATCISGAIYYMSCACGHKGSETFTIGNPDLTKHDWNDTDICSLCDAVKISEKTFPDPNFRAYILENHCWMDQILTSDHAFITLLDISNLGIADLKGLELFPALMHLSCNGNALTNLDVSFLTQLRYLTADNNDLISLNVSGCTNLSSLLIKQNNLKTLDLSGMSNLLSLNCSQNELTSLTLTGCTLLKNLYCGDNALPFLDLSECETLLGANATVSIGDQVLTLEVDHAQRSIFLESIVDDVSRVEGTRVSNGVIQTYSGMTSEKYEYHTGLGDIRMEVTVSVLNPYVCTLSYTDITESTHNEVCLVCGEGYIGISHNFNQAVVKEEGLIFEATCSYPAAYRLSCKCGLLSPSQYQTFDYGEKLPHTDENEDLKCEACGSQITLFKGISVSLGADLSVNFFVTKYYYSDLEMRFTINGYSKTVAGTTEGDQLKFVFDGVAPQWMGDLITAELLRNGKVIATQEHSVMEYLQLLLTVDASVLGMSIEQYNKLVILIADLMVYGGAAQVHTGYKTDALVSEGVEGTPFRKLTETDTAGDPMGEAVTFTGMNVYFNSANRLMFRFESDNLEDVTFTVSVNGGEEKAIGYTASGNCYIIMTDTIMATGFDDLYTVKAYKGGVLDATLTYSLKSYVYAKQNGEGSLAALARATYNYGLAAKAYVQA